MKKDNQKILDYYFIKNTSNCLDIFINEVIKYNKRNKNALVIVAIGFIYFYIMYIENMSLVHKYEQALTYINNNK